MDNAFAKPIDGVLSTLGVDRTTGLTDEQVSRLRAKHGKNGMNACVTFPSAPDLPAMELSFHLILLGGHNS